MVDPVVKLDGELADLADARARAEGRTLEAVIERMLREYVTGERSASVTTAE